MTRGLEGTAMCECRFTGCDRGAALGGRWVDAVVRGRAGTQELSVLRLAANLKLL